MITSKTEIILEKKDNRKRSGILQNVQLHARRDTRYKDFHLQSHPKTYAKLGLPNIKPYPGTGAKMTDHLLTFKSKNEKILYETSN